MPGGLHRICCCGDDDDCDLTAGSSVDVNFWDINTPCEDCEAVPAAGRCLSGSQNYQGVSTGLNGTFNLTFGDLFGSTREYKLDYPFVDDEEEQTGAGDLYADVGCLGRRPRTRRFPIRFLRVHLRDDGNAKCLIRAVFAYSFPCNPAAFVYDRKDDPGTYRTQTDQVPNGECGARISGADSLTYATNVMSDGKCAVFFNGP